MSFPLDITIEILLRLPAKSLLRFKSVCKSWYALLNDLGFINLHLERSLAAQINLHLVIKNPILHLADFDTFSNPIELNYLFKNPDNGGVGVVGSCNGLLCLQSYDFNHPLLIYNPTTQTYKTLPLLAISNSFSFSRSIFNFGFGYDSVSKDYKCVRVIRNFGDQMMSPIEDGIMVYSMKDDSWRKARSPSVPYYIDYHNGKSVFVNDTIHWGGGISDNNEARELLPIAAFSLRDETFSTLPIPNFESVDLIRVVVGVLDRCLCLWISYLVGDSDVFVMKEYGVAGSWTKLFSIAKRNGYEEVERPMCYSMNLKELFVHMHLTLQVASVDLDTMEINDVKVANFNRCTDAHVCVENLYMLENRNYHLFVEEDHMKRRGLQRKNKR